MPAKSVLVTSFSRLNTNEPGTTTATLYLNPDRIIGFNTRTVPYLTTGIVDVIYLLPVNNTEVQISMVITQTAAAFNTAINANSVAT